MAHVSLQTVFDDARRAIETGAADKAIGIAQHILVHFPRMIEASRLLGEAYLNAGQSEQAAAAFTQVLQADPENVAAYYGQGLALQSLEQRTAAITAFERALEIQPNLADLRTQLMRLYSETPGSAGQFRLSRAGLGRLYARGGMFGQAIDEFRAVLDIDPNRDDVKVALAEALWRDGQEDDATDFCRDVLDRRPELLKPTLLLGYMLFASGQPEGEALWRRAAEQDASMALGRTLFDILPPIRIEEAIVPEFNEAEWRAKEARRITEQAVSAPAPAPAATNDDDFFADSWLSSAGTTAAVATTAQVYEAPSFTPSSTSNGGNDDDDLLASLLGFGGDAPVVEQAEPESEGIGGVQPFAFDDWDTPARGESGSAAKPASLQDIGLDDDLPAAQPLEDTGNVKPFSLDDWSFDEDPTPATSAPQAQTNTSTTDEFDLRDVQAFSLDDEPVSNRRITQPLQFEAERDALADVSGGVKPFSLDDDDDLGLAPFSFDDDEPISTPMASQSPPAPQTSSSDAGLGAVQPFSLDDWGLDDDEGPSLAQPSQNQFAQPDEMDDLGGFSPFSLDELALDSLEQDTTSSLSGPSLPVEEDVQPERASFSWEEPTWRAQVSQNNQGTPNTDESIFAKLMRNRPSAPEDQSAPTSSEPASLDEASFFSMDDESLRLDLEDIDQNVSTSEFADLMDDQQPFLSPSAAAPTPEALTAEDTSPINQLGSAQSNEVETDDNLLPFSLDELTSDLPSFEEPSQLQSSSVQSEQTELDQEMVPFSLSELGLSDDELAALDEQPELAADTVESESTPLSRVDEESEMAPFSLSDLGLDDDELAMLSLDGDATLSDVDTSATTPSSPVDDTRSETSGDDNGAELSLEQAVGDVEPEMTPFSLAELGLTDDEIALFGSPEELDAEDSNAPNVNDQQEWVDLQSELDVDLPATRTPEDFLTEAKITDGDVLSVLETMPMDQSSNDEPEMTPFSLTDLGLNDDELALFQEIQAGQASTDGVDTVQSADQDTSPFSLADLDVTTEQQEPASPFSVADLGTTTEQQEPVPPFSLADFGDEDEGATFIFEDDEDAVEQTNLPTSTVDEQAVPDHEQVEDGGFLSRLGDVAISAVTSAAETVRDVAGAVVGRAPDAASNVVETAKNLVGGNSEAPKEVESGQPEALEPFDAADASFDFEYADSNEILPSSLTLDESSADDTFDTPTRSGELLETTSNDYDGGETAQQFGFENQPLPNQNEFVAQASTGLVSNLSSSASASSPSVTSGASSGLDAIHAQLQADPENDALRLAVARMSQGAGNVAQAIEQYKVLIKRGHLVDEVVEDLQDTINDNEDPQMLRRLHRLLGDAYMKQNRFREAMDEYSWTLARSS